jgi:hypothetical protein
LIEVETAFINPRYVARAERADGKAVARELFIRGIATRWRAEHGFAVPTALFMVLAAFAAVSVGVTASVNVQRGTVRDQGTKSAVQVAEAGVNEALLHYNRIPPSETNPCSPVSASPPDGSGWCPPVSGNFNGAPYTYQVHPWTDADDKLILDVIGSSTVGGASRRVGVRASASSEWEPFNDYQVKAGEWIHMDSNAEIRAGTATNGDIVLSSNARQCGQASVGIGNQLLTDANAGYFQNHNCTTANEVVNEEELTLPSVNQGDVDINNSNTNFFGTNPVTSGKPRDVCWNQFKGDGTAGTCGLRELNLSQNTAVTLQSGNYSFCKLTMSSNTALYVQGGATAVIYFDSPENCGYSSGVVQLEMDSNARITPTGTNSADIRLLFVGSSGEGDDFRQTQIHMSSNTFIPAACEQNFVLYAPLSDVTLNSNSTYCGGLAGKTLHLDSNARVWVPPTPLNVDLPATAPHYEVERFVECGAAPQTVPDSGC